MPGAVQQLIEAEVGGRFTVRERSVTVPAAAVEILPNNPERAAYLLANTGAVLLQLGWRLPVAAPDAVPIAANGGVLSVTVREDFILPTWNVYGVVAAGNTTVRVVEVIRESGP